MSWPLRYVVLLLPTLASAQNFRVGGKPENLKFSANGRFLAVQCEHHVYVRDLRNSRTHTFPFGEFCDISPAGSRVAITNNGRLTVWGVETGKPIRIWPHPTASATFSPDGREVLFFASKNGGGLERGKDLGLARLDIRTGAFKLYDQWTAGLSNFMARWFSKEAFSATKAQQVSYTPVFGVPLTWRNDERIQVTLQAEGRRSLVFAILTLNLSDQKPKLILPGFGLYVLWNGDYLWKDGTSGSAEREPEEWYAVWHKGKSHKLLDDPDFVTEPAPSGDAGAYPGCCPSATPWIAFYGIRHIAQQVDEPYAKKQLRRQRLIVLLVNARTKRKVLVVNRHYDHLSVRAAFSPDAKWIAYTAPSRRDELVLQRVKL